MKKVKLFLYTLLFLSLLIPSRYPPSIEAQTPISVQTTPETNQEKAARLVKEFSTAYHVSGAEMYATIKYETAGTFDPCIQSKYMYKGAREESYGLAQIHLPAHPDITKEQACNPVFAVAFMAREFSLNRQWEWTGWKLLKSQGII